MARKNMFLDFKPQAARKSAEERRIDDRDANRASIATLLVNAALAALKLFAGFVARSGAMISDAINSLSDVVSNFVVLIGVKLSRMDADSEHPYGHERIEYIASIILATLLAVTGLGVGWDAVQKIFGAAQLVVPGRLALAAAAATIVTKEIMYRYTKGVALRVGSGALMASACDHRSDVFSSAGVFIGILGARLGVPVLDPVASVVICLLILKSALDIYRDAIDKLVDKACPDETQAALRAVVLGQAGVLRVDHLQTRQFGQMIYVDVEIAADPALSLSDAHEIAAGVHRAIEDAMASVKHCMVHVNPYREIDPPPAAETDADAVPHSEILVEK